LLSLVEELCQLSFCTVNRSLVRRNIRLNNLLLGRLYYLVGSYDWVIYNSSGSYTTCRQD